MYVIGTDKYYAEGWDKKSKEDKVMEIVKNAPDDGWNGSKGADLQCLDLSNTNFSGRNFGKKVYFAHQDGTSSNLSGADFSNATFNEWIDFGCYGNSGSDLRNTNFSGAKFNGIDFGSSGNSGSNLKNANFSNATFTNNYVDFGFSNGSGSNVSGADFRGINQIGAHTGDSNFCGAKFDSYNENIYIYYVSAFGLCPDGVSAEPCEQGHLTAIPVSECPAWTGPNEVTNR